MSSEKTKEMSIIFGFNVNHVPIPEIPSTKEVCETCDGKFWLGNKKRDFMDKVIKEKGKEHVLKLCHQCVANLFYDAKSLGVTGITTFNVDETKN